MPNIFAFGLRVHQYLKQFPLLGSFLEVGVIYDPKNFICTNLNLLVPRLLHTKHQCIWAIGL